MTRIDVVAGIIYNADQSQILIALRSADKHQGNLWEFPGGKIEPSETSEQALMRELREELSITTLACKPYQKLDFDYPDKLVCLDIWEVTEFVGTPIGVEQQEIRWVRIDELSGYSFPAANLPIVKKLTAIR